MNSQTTQVVFSDLGFPVPVEQRPLWRLSIICCCISTLGKPESGLNLNKVRVACWMLIRKHLWQQYIDYVCYGNGKKPKVAVDRATDRAIELGLEKDFFSLINGRLVISDNGALLMKISEENTLFTEEKDFLIYIKTKLTDKVIKNII